MVATPASLAVPAIHEHAPERCAADASAAARAGHRMAREVIEGDSYTQRLALARRIVRFAAEQARAADVDEIAARWFID